MVRRSASGTMHSFTTTSGTVSVPAAGRASIRNFLRRETGAIHRDLHRAEPFGALLDGTMTLRQYCNLLSVLAAFHSSMALLVQSGADALDLRRLSEMHRRRLARLQEDLASLRIEPQKTAALGSVRGEAFAIGCAYTVQGSTLGGRVIDRALHSLLPTGQGRSFFHGDDSDQALWSEFCAALEARRYTPDELHALGAGADFAFQVFSNGLERCPK